MNNNTNINILKYSLWGCLYLILITPLLLSSDFLFPFITLKAVYFRILVETALFLYLLLALSDSYYRPRLSKTMWLILGFGLVILITAIFGVNPHRSFWGNIERGEGFITISHIIALCFLISQVFRKKSEWLNFLTGSLAVSLGVSFYALAQKFGADWTIHAGESRLSSTLGNAAYLGAYSLGHFWISLILLINRKSLWYKIILGIAALSQLYILFETETRGAAVGLLGAIFLTALIYLIRGQNKKIKLIFLAIILFIAVTGTALWINKDADWMPKRGMANRVLHISFDDITTQSRFLTWDSSFKGWKDRLLLGYGWENYNIAFNKYFHAEIFRDRGSQIWFDRAHNTILDVAVATGLIGLVVYLSIFILALKNLRNYSKKDFYTALLLFAFLSGHFIQNIFVFDALATYVMLFTILAIISSLSIQNQQIEHTAKPLNLYALIFGFIAFLIIIFQLNINPAKANQDGLESLKYFRLKQIDKAVNYYDQALERNTYQSDEIRQKFAEQAMNFYPQIKSSDDGQKLFKKAMDGINANIKENPLDAQNYLYLMAMYNMAFQENPPYLNLVISTGQKVIKLSPTRPQIYFEMGRAAINGGQVEQGTSYFRKAVSLNPSTLDSRWNLLTAYIITGRAAEASQEYKTMLDLGLEEDSNTIERLERIYGSVSNYPELIKLYQKAIQKYPNEIKYWTKLAKAYADTGDKEKAISTASRVLEITKDPAVIKEAQKFLEELTR